MHLVGSASPILQIVGMKGVVSCRRGHEQVHLDCLAGVNPPEVGHVSSQDTDRALWERSVRDQIVSDRQLL